MRAVFTFDTTHHALWAEEVAREHRVPHEVIPAPPEASARCSIAIETTDLHREAFGARLDAQGVPFRIYRPGSPPPDA